MPTELKDISFLILILAMAGFFYYVTADVFLAIFCIIFLGINYLEAEIVRITVSVKKGDLKLRHDRIPAIKEYHNIIKRARDGQTLWRKKLKDSQIWCECREK